MGSTILILGASYGGLTVAHKLLKHTRSSSTKLKVILVNPSSKFYWNLASVRAIVPGLIKDEALFHDIADGFKYAGSDFEFVAGTAKSVDIEKKVVSISKGGESQDQPYDILILATGSRSDGDVPWKATGSYEETLDRLHSTQVTVAKAKSIVVAGGGATGVETTSELAFEFGDKKSITLITSGATIMQGSPLTPSIIQGAEKELRRMHVKIVPSTKVTGVTTLSSGETELTLSSGEKLLTDLYLPTTGLLPNTQYLPPNLLNGKGEVMVDENLRVKGTNDVWAVGDVVDIQRSGFMITGAQAQHLVKNVDLVLKKQNPLAYKVPAKDMLAMSLGRKGGTGIAMGFKLPSFMVYHAKGKTLGVDKMAGLVTGSSL